MFDYLMTHRKCDLLKIMKESDTSSHYSLNICFPEIIDCSPELGSKILKQPDETFTEFKEIIQNVQKTLLEEENLINNKEKLTIKKYVHIRIFALPSCPELHRTIFPKYNDSGLYLQISGTVVRTSLVKMLEMEREYMCVKCKHLMKEYANYDQYNKIEQPQRCKNSDACKSKTIINRSKLGSETCTNYQEVKIQEHMTKLGCEGSMPSAMWVTLEHDLTDSCKPGDNVTICGIVKRRWKPPNKSQRLEVEMVLQAYHVQVNNGFSSSSIISPELKLEFQQFWDAHKKNPIEGRNIILSSFCTQIFGLYVVKLAVLVTLAGGSQLTNLLIQNNDDTGVRIRTEPHILLVGDPGTGKSQILKYASKLISRSVLTTGVGSTSAGLTAAAVMEDGEWQLEAGALVLSDGGICCIDEFNSMKEHDRTSIHEAMEQQTISIAKANIITKLKTRCSILAATNFEGQLKRKYTVSRMIALPSSLLSRFDLILLLNDIMEEKWDTELCNYLLNSSENNKTPNEKNKNNNLWSFEKLQAYISIVKKINPELSEEANRILTAYYQMQRRFNERDKSRTTVRLLDSLIRISQGHAKLMFHTKVTILDAIYTIFLMEISMHEHSIFNLNWDCYTPFPEKPMDDYLKIMEEILVALNLEELCDKEKESMNNLKNCEMNEIQSSQVYSIIRQLEKDNLNLNDERQQRNKRRCDNKKGGDLQINLADIEDEEEDLINEAIRREIVNCSKDKENRKEFDLSQSQKSYASIFNSTQNMDDFDDQDEEIRQHINDVNSSKIGEEAMSSLWQNMDDFDEEIRQEINGKSSSKIREEKRQRTTQNMDDSDEEMSQEINGKNRSKIGEEKRQRTTQNMDGSDEEIRQEINGTNSSKIREEKRQRMTQNIGDLDEEISQEINGKKSSKIGEEKRQRTSQNRDVLDEEISQEINGKNSSKIGEEKRQRMTQNMDHSDEEISQEIDGKNSSKMREEKRQRITQNMYDSDEEIRQEINGKNGSKIGEEKRQRTTQNMDDSDEEMRQEINGKNSSKIGEKKRQRTTQNMDDSDEEIRQEINGKNSSKIREKKRQRTTQNIDDLDKEISQEINGKNSSKIEEEKRQRMTQNMDDFGKKISGKSSNKGGQKRQRMFEDDSDPEKSQNVSETRQKLSTKNVDLNAINSQDLIKTKISNVSKRQEKQKLTEQMSSQNLNFNQVNSQEFVMTKINKENVEFNMANGQKLNDKNERIKRQRTMVEKATASSESSYTSSSIFNLTESDEELNEVLNQEITNTQINKDIDQKRQKSFTEELSSKNVVNKQELNAKNSEEKERTKRKRTIDKNSSSSQCSYTSSSIFNSIESDEELNEIISQEFNIQINKEEQKLMFQDETRKDSEQNVYCLNSHELNTKNSKEKWTKRQRTMEERTTTSSSSQWSSYTSSSIFNSTQNADLDITINDKEDEGLNTQKTTLIINKENSIKKDKIDNEIQRRGIDLNEISSQKSYTSSIFNATQNVIDDDLLLNISMEENEFHDKEKDLKNTILINENKDGEVNKSRSSEKISRISSQSSYTTTSIFNLNNTQFDDMDIDDDFNTQQERSSSSRINSNNAATNIFNSQTLLDFEKEYESDIFDYNNLQIKEHTK